MFKLRLKRCLNHAALTLMEGKMVKKETKAKKAKSKGGRPKAKWKTKATAQRIFEAMRDGWSLRSYCLHNNLPFTKVCEWLNTEFCEDYADAQNARADYFFDEILTIADDCSHDKGAVMKAKLQIESRKWIMARMAPKKYGEKVNVDVSGTTEVKHDGKVDIAPADSAIQGINAIIERVIRAGKAERVEDTGEE